MKNLVLNTFFVFLLIFTNIFSVEAQNPFCAYDKVPSDPFESAEKLQDYWRDGSASTGFHASRKVYAKMYPGGKWRIKQFLSSKAVWYNGSFSQYQSESNSKGLTYVIEAKNSGITPKGVTYPHGNIQSDDNVHWCEIGDTSWLIAKVICLNSPRELVWYSPPKPDPVKPDGPKIEKVTTSFSTSDPGKIPRDLGGRTMTGKIKTTGSSGSLRLGNPVSIKQKRDLMLNIQLVGGAWRMFRYFPPINQPGFIPGDGPVPGFIPGDGPIDGFIPGDEPIDGFLPGDGPIDGFIPGDNPIGGFLPGDGRP